MDLPGDMPGTFLQLKNSNLAVVNTCGYHDHSLNLIDLKSQKIVSTVALKQNWIGVAQISDNEIWVSGGFANASKGLPAVRKFKIEDGQLIGDGEVPIFSVSEKDVFVSSMVATSDAVYVLNCQQDEVLKVSKTGKVISRIKVGYRPYGIAVSPDGSEISVSNWGGKSVSQIDAATFNTVREIAVEAQPTSLKYSADGRLFVTSSGSDVVSVIQDRQVREKIRTGISTKQTIGPVPISLAFRSDFKTLYVAIAGNNCITAIDVSRVGRSRRLGLIPTERYPAVVAVSADDRQLIIASAKGGYGPNAMLDASQASSRARRQGDAAYNYIGEQLQGRLRIMPVPSLDDYKALTRQTMENKPIWEASASELKEKANIERNALRKIKHVVYVIRENRTYDQVLGDISKGNGEPKLTIFGQNVTPNGHKIANDFVLFDNLFTDGETSQAGHQWTDAAYATDYCEKQWILGYSRRETLRSDTRLTSSPGDYLWTLARKHGLKARVFGEYVDQQEDHDSLSNPEIKADPEKYGYSASYEKIFARGGRDTEKVDDFLRELREAEVTGKWPNLMVMALPEDHTHGFSPGAFSPRAMVASNDLALGKLVEGISHSKFWAETAIFVIQDDAQDGPDHVDSHRTVGYVVSPYTRRGIVDHRHYSTASMLRTMELMLGLPPMSQYDEFANTMHASFSTKPNFDPFKAVEPTYDINERNPKNTELARRSAKLDFSEVDKADFAELNHILWEGYRPGVPYPILSPIGTP